IAVFQPCHPHGRRQLVSGDFFPISKRIALTLHDQCRRLDRPEMLNSKLIWLADWVEGIAQAYQARNTGFVRDETGDAASHRLAANDQTFAPQLLHDLQPRLSENWFSVRRLSPAGNPLRRHVRVLKSDDAKATLAESRGEEVHEWRIHAGARTMSQCDGSRAIGVAVEQEFGIGRQRRLLLAALVLSAYDCTAGHPAGVDDNDAEDTGLGMAATQISPR